MALGRSTQQLDATEEAGARPARHSRVPSKALDALQGKWDALLGVFSVGCGHVIHGLRSHMRACKEVRTDSLNEGRRTAGKSQ
eukprot:scaffold264106_cov32-Tisochrysis_lutea.AAC.3